MQRLVKLMVIIQVITLKIVFSQSVFSPPPDEEKFKMAANKTTEKIIVDGLLDENAWSLSQVAANFIESSSL